MPELTVISLGWGVQSWTLAAMSALGELPRVDAVVHSDTGHERAATYSFADQWTPWLEAHGIKVVTARAPQTDVVRTAPSGNRYTIIPALTLGEEQDVVTQWWDDSADDDDTWADVPIITRMRGKGQLRRQCTSRWKIEPMRAWLRAELKQRGCKAEPGIVEQWMGISLDEWQRARTSETAYITHRYPLLEQKLTRADCVAWLQAHDLPVPPKSACVFCPYHNQRAWEELKREDGPDWGKALRVDNLLRDIRPNHTLYLHTRRVPLDAAVPLPEDQPYQQPGLFPVESEEATCDSGYCFL
jgi:hypothetical protein